MKRFSRVAELIERYGEYVYWPFVLAYIVYVVLKIAHIL